MCFLKVNIVINNISTSELMFLRRSVQLKSYFSSNIPQSEPQRAFIFQQKRLTSGLISGNFDYLDAADLLLASWLIEFSS